MTATHNEMLDFEVKSSPVLRYIKIVCLKLEARDFQKVDFTL